jgi:DNA processing protein
LVTGITTFPWREPAEQEIAKAANANVAIVTMDDPVYPERLKKIPDPPNYLYIKGAFLSEDANAVAIVGTRKPTHYGRTVTHRIAYELASASFTIVSGMARGIDTQAHRGALAAKGRTIAVLGCGIDMAYPHIRKPLRNETGGRLLPGTEPHYQRAVARDGDHRSRRGQRVAYNSKEHT